MSKQTKCARCVRPLGEVTGESAIYNPNGPPILLCEPCFFDEDAQITALGGNDLPDTLARYKVNLQADKAAR